MDLASNTCLRIKPLEELTLMDDYMFAAVMRNKANLKPLLEYIQKMKITSVKTSEERRHEYMVMKIHEMETRAEGRAEGRVEGRAEGIRDKTIEDARAMYDDGLEPERIARILKLEISEVEVILGLLKMA